MKIIPLLFVGLLGLVACSSEPPEEPSPEPTVEDSRPTPEAPLEPEATPKPTPEATPEATPAPTPTPEITPESTPDAVPEEDGTLPSAAALQPFRDSWMYPTILNFRPAQGVVSSLDPPRFSWPYLQDTVVTEITQIPPTVFSLQIASTPDFSAPVVNIIDTPYNFYNAIPALGAGQWYWRVGYGAAPEQQWTDPREFRIAEEAVVWGREAIHQALEKLQALPRPRTGPADGDWEAMARHLLEDPATKRPMDQLRNVVNRAMQQDWWEDFPESDANPGGRLSRPEQTRYINILRNLTCMAYIYRLTGDETMRPALDGIVTMASWPAGGLLSPEALGGQTKLPSQAVEFFAVVYDWFADDWTPEQAATLRETVAWRLEQMFFDPKSIIWQQGDKSMRHYGLAYHGSSHPYQNFAWAVPAILLMAGDIEIADRLTPMALHYLTGVTAPDGPDEGYNEGHGYSNEKAGTLLHAMVLTDMLLPELQLGRNPMLHSLVDWFAFIFPGAPRLPWGDSWLESARGIGGENLLRLTYLTHSPVARYLWQDRARGAVVDNPASSLARPWLDLGAWVHYRPMLEEMPEGTPEDLTLFLPEAGWLFVQSRPIGTLADYMEAVGMQFQMRPRGGYAHSYPSDGSFFWFAYGQGLNGGGGWQSWASLGFSRSPMSQNVVLINGQGHDSINTYQPQRAFTARPLAFEEGERYVYWAAELTEGYRHLGDIERVHRHVLFLDNRWFLIFDDLAVGASHDPATFHWLFHIEPELPLETFQTDTATGFRYQVGHTQAAVYLAGSGEKLELDNRIGRDGYTNPVTGEDHYPADMARAEARAIFKPFLTRPLMHHNLWIGNKEPVREFTFLSALTAAPGDGELPGVEFLSDRVVRITPAGEAAVTVSFDPETPADVVIDPARVQAHAVASRPSDLPLSSSATTGSETKEEIE